MGKIVGCVLLLVGIAGGLYQWIVLQRECQMRIEAFCIFLHKTIFCMETEKIKIVDYFAKYRSTDEVMTESFQEISKRLYENTYPNGEMVWEEVIKERKWNLDEETYSIVLKCGKGFFGRSRAENICFLKKQLEELECQQKQNNERDTKERKVWVPVSMLSGILLIIILI